MVMPICLFFRFVDSAGGQTFQLVSCEELGVLKFWVRILINVDNFGIF